jgi:hypothetical protein
LAHLVARTNTSIQLLLLKKIFESAENFFCLLKKKAKQNIALNSHPTSQAKLLACSIRFFFKKSERVESPRGELRSSCRGGGLGRFCKAKHRPQLSSHLASQIIGLLYPIFY